jgi:L-threonylcarbamoyladenylate synthase
MDIPTRTLDPDRRGYDTAAAILARGGLVAFPTETVYGLGADARNDRAVAGIFAAKDRPRFNPLIVHVADIATAQTYVDWSDLAQRLADAFWPGPLPWFYRVNPIPAFPPWSPPIYRLWRSVFPPTPWRTHYCAPLAGRLPPPRPIPRAG